MSHARKLCDEKSKYKVARKVVKKKIPKKAYQHSK